MRKQQFFIFFFLMLLGCGLYAQEPPQLPSIGDAQKEKFNQLFFDALREKALENFEVAFELFSQAHRMDPKNDVVCYELGILNFNRGKLMQAEDLLLKAVNNAPGNLYYLEALAEVYSRTGKKAAEAAIWERLMVLQPNEITHSFQAASAYIDAADLKKALAILKNTENQFGLSAEIVEARQSIFLKQGKVKKAAAEMQRLINQQPAPEYYRNLGQLYTANEMPKEAFTVYKKMLAVYPKDPVANLEMAEHHRLRGDMTTAFKHIKVAAASEELGIDPKIQILVSLFQHTEFDSELLADTYEMAEIVIATHPSDPKGYAMLGDFLLRDEKYMEARNVFRTATRLPNGDKPNIWNQVLLLDSELGIADSLKIDALAANALFPSQPLPYLMLGLVYMQSEEYKAAVEILESGLMYTLGNRPMERQFKEFLADAHYRTKSFKKSDAYFDELLADNPDDAAILNNYAYFLAVRGEHLDRALKMTERSNQLRPDDPTFLDTYAWVLFKKGDYASALKTIERVMALMDADQSGEVLEHYGDILFKNQQVEKAVEMWIKAKDLGGTTATITQKITEKRYVE